MLPSEEFRGVSEEVSSGVKEEGWSPCFLWLPLSSSSPLACAPAMLPSAVLSHGQEGCIRDKKALVQFSYSQDLEA